MVIATNYCCYIKSWCFFSHLCTKKPLCFLSEAEMKNASHHFNFKNVCHLGELKEEKGTLVEGQREGMKDGCGSECTWLPSNYCCFWWDGCRLSQKHTYISWFIRGLLKSDISVYISSQEGDTVTATHIQNISQLSHAKAPRSCWDFCC